MQMDESVAAGFVLDHLGERSLSDFLAQEELRDVLQLVRKGQDIAATQRYQQVTGAPLQQAHFAVRLIQRFLG